MQLTAAELAELRDVAESAMPDLCTIKTRTETNTKGSVAVTHAATYTGVACRLMPMPSRGDEAVSGERIAGINRFVFTCPWDQPIGMGDQVIHANLTYEVVGVSPNHSFRTANRAELVLVT